MIVQGYTWGAGAGEEGRGIYLGVHDTWEYKGET